MQTVGHPDLLDEPEHLRTPFAGSLILHAGLAGALIAGAFFQKTPIQIGDINPGSGIAVNVVNQIPIVRKQGNINPVANDTESTVPQEPLKLKDQRPASTPPPPNAIELPAKTPTPKIERKPSTAYRPPVEARPNQVYSRVPQAMVSPQVGMRGGAGIGIGPNSTFGYQFGAYAQQIRDLIASKWNQAGVTARPGAQAVVTFQIMRDGSLRAIQLVQTSGSYTLDISARRAVMDASPLPPLPGGFPRNEADVELFFELGR